MIDSINDTLIYKLTPKKDFSTCFECFCSTFEPKKDFFGFANLAKDKIVQYIIPEILFSTAGKAVVFMIKNSSIWRTFYSGWLLISDYDLPASWRPLNGEQGEQSFNALYTMPVWGAAGGLAAVVLGGFLSRLLPVNGAAILFALLLTAAGELRTASRALALTVTTIDQLINRKTLSEARQLRDTTLTGTSGVIPLLLAVGLLGGKFFAILLAARTGHFGIAGAAWAAALGAEGVLAAEPHAVNVPSVCRNAKAEYIVFIAGFFLLFNLVALPLATLIATGLAAVTAIVILNLCLKRFGEISANDITVTGYLLELIVWVIFALMIG